MDRDTVHTLGTPIPCSRLVSYYPRQAQAITSAFHFISDMWPSSNIYLKLENLQPSGSFKSRGIGNLMFRAVEASSPDEDIHFYCSSGGNAGLACVASAIALHRRATIVVPLSTTAFMVGKLRDLGADVVQIGENWAAADKHLREEVMAEHDPRRRGVYVPPFDHPDVWSGAATLVDELLEQMDVRMDGIVCNVGGGGLLCGVMEGIQKGRFEKPKVLAIETEGADALMESVKAGEMVTLPAITSIATSLGAPRVAEEAFKWTQRAGEGLITAVVTDAEAVMGVSRFLDDARMLVEVACGASIAPVYNGDLRKLLGKGLDNEAWAKMNVVIVVCGGSNINMGMLEKYKKEYVV